MSRFNGFSDSESITELPDSFFTTLLREIDDPRELKVVLLALERIQHLDGSRPGLRSTDLDGETLGLPVADVQVGLDKAVRHGILLMSRHGGDTAYFLNSALGRAAAGAFTSGDPLQASMTGPLERRNIFKLYEENIGPLTPLIADALLDAEKTYSEEWVGEAIGLAVTNNKRNWKYCEAILKRWKEEGRAQKQNRRNDPAARRRDVEDTIRKYLGG
jgi:DNA replication protein